MTTFEIVRQFCGMRVNSRPWRKRCIWVCAKRRLKPCVEATCPIVAKIAARKTAERQPTGTQHRQPAICPTCSGNGSYPYRGPDGNPIQVQCAPCEGTGKLQAGA